MRSSAPEVDRKDMRAGRRELRRLGAHFGVRDNDITFTGPAPAGSGIHLDAISGPIDQAMITGVTVALNSARGALRSLNCSQTGGSFPQPIISLGNRWTVAPTCPVATLQAGQ